jgi:hypothetical protein
MSEADRNWLVGGKNFRPQEIRRTTQPWNSDVFLMGQLLGHLHGRTTMSRYFNFCGELLRTICHVRPSYLPIPNKLRLAVGTRSRLRIPTMQVKLSFLIVCYPIIAA